MARTKTKTIATIARDLFYDSIWISVLRKQHGTWPFDFFPFQRTSTHAIEHISDERYLFASHIFRNTVEVVVAAVFFLCFWFSSICMNYSVWEHILKHKSTVKSRIWLGLLFFIQVLRSFFRHSSSLATLDILLHNHFSAIVSHKVHSSWKKSPFFLELIEKKHRHFAFDTRSNSNLWTFFTEFRCFLWDLIWECEIFIWRIDFLSSFLLWKLIFFLHFFNSLIFFLRFTFFFSV